MFRASASASASAAGPVHVPLVLLAQPLVVAEAEEGLGKEAEAGVAELQEGLPGPHGGSVEANALH
jgi:hypothetical protein